MFLFLIHFSFNFIQSFLFNTIIYLVKYYFSQSTDTHKIITLFIKKCLESGNIMKKIVLKVFARYVGTKTQFTGSTTGMWYHLGQKHGIKMPQDKK